MKIERTYRMEYLAFRVEGGLENVCSEIEKEFQLPSFEFDYENENHWGIVEKEEVEFNVSWPYEEGKLHEWLSSTPINSNVGVILILSIEHPRKNDEEWIQEELLKGFGQKMANRLNTSITHHRTWFSPEEFIEHSNVFEPKQNQPGSGSNA